MKRNRIIAIGVAVAAMAALGAGYAYSRAANATSVTTAKASTQSLSVTVNAAGKLVSGHPTAVFAPAVTTVLTLPVADGSVVKAGDVVATLEDSALQATLAQAQAAATAARSARTQLNGTGTSDKAAAAKAAADAAVTATKRQLDLAQANLAKATVTAPADGTLVYAPGIGVGAGVSPTTPLFQLVDPTALLFEAQVDEADIAGLQVGQKVSVALDAFPGAPFTGTVAQLRPTAVTTTTGGTAFPVSISLDAAGKRVMLGMSGHATISLSSVSDAVTVPIQSVFTDAGAKYVWVLGTNSAVKKTAVTLGAATDTLVQVTAGVSSGDTVVTSLITTLKDGQTVSAK